MLKQVHKGKNGEKREVAQRVTGNFLFFLVRFVAENAVIASEVRVANSFVFRLADPVAGDGSRDVGTCAGENDEEDDNAVSVECDPCVGQHCLSIFAAHTSNTQESVHQQIHKSGNYKY